MNWFDTFGHLYYLVNLLFVFVLLQIIGFAIGIISPLRHLFIGRDALLNVVEESTSMLGYTSHNFTSSHFHLATNLLLL